jgi:hypothetical protein
MTAHASSSQQAKVEKCKNDLLSMGFHSDAISRGIQVSLLPATFLSSKSKKIQLAPKFLFFYFFLLCCDFV